MLLEVDPKSPLPLYAQLERGIRAAIASGEIVEGEQLPTVRQLAVALRVNANTVARVYAGLERAGLLATQRGVGTFVRKAAAPQPPGRRRERELHALGDRALAEAWALGISPQELIRHLRSRIEEDD